jgi:hypothetical protein
MSRVELWRRKMARNLGELTAKEFEELVERAIDRRFEVWLTQLMDAFEGLTDENGDELRPDFAASLRRSLEQARSGEGTTLDLFRRELGR